MFLVKCRPNLGKCLCMNVVLLKSVSFPFEGLRFEQLSKDCIYIFHHKFQL